MQRLLTRVLAAIIVMVAGALLLSALSAPAGADETDDTGAGGAGTRSGTAGDAPRVPRSPNGAYVVMLRDAPAAAHAPLASPGRFDRTAAPVRDYVRHLAARRRSVLGGVHGARILQTYDYASVGFTATMSRAAAQDLAQSPDVLFVAPDVARQGADTDTPSYLGLTGRSGLWHRLGGSRTAGDGVIIGDIDSGITPESPAFAALPPSRTDAAIRRRWNGSCVAGSTGPAVHCNNKLIGAKVFGPGTVDAVPDEYVGSPRDYDGHGTHTASTAAGDHGVPMRIGGRDFGRFSGVAPAARIAMYKALWHKADNTTEGNTSDLTKAIDEAVADGVDVITYSITGNTSVVDDPVAYAFYNAAKAGVFVAAAAANTGPSASTVQNDYPWVTTVGAGTFDIARRAAVTLGDGRTYDGVGLGAAVPASPLVVATAVGRPGADATKVRQCWSGTWDPAHPEGFLDPAQVAGRIVVCDRGANDRTDKSRAVAAAGGVGMILVNTGPNTLNADLHAVPTVHLDDVSGAAVKGYVATADAPTAAIAAGRDDRTDAPAVASFSARGPALPAGSALLKPDVIAPGVDILAAVAPVNHEGRGFDFESGTSMATPHVAGAAALLRQRHPGWSPMAVKSALMSTARTTTRAGLPIPTDAGDEATPFDMGSGEIDPTTAAGAEVVYDSGAADWAAFLCGQGTTPPDGACRGRLDAGQLNVPSIAVPDLAGSTSVRRVLTNTSGHTWRGRVRVAAPTGVRVAVRPARLVIRPGRRAAFTVHLTRTSAPLGEDAFGSLTWTSGHGPAVRSPLVVRPVALAAPAEVAATGSDGTARVALRPGYTGTLATTVAGPVPAIENRAALHDADGTPFPVAHPRTGPHTARFTVATPAGTTYARFAAFAADLAPGTDVDLYVYAGGTDDLVAQSAQAGSDEWVWVGDPAARSYDVYVDLAAGPDQEVRQPSWVLGAAEPLLEVTPAQARVRAGTPITLTARWQGLDPARRYLARLGYGDGRDVLDATTLLSLTP